MCLHFFTRFFHGDVEIFLCHSTPFRRHDVHVKRGEDLGPVFPLLVSNGRLVGLLEHGLKQGFVLRKFSVELREFFRGPVQPFGELGQLGGRDAQEPAAGGLGDPVGLDLVDLNRGVPRLSVLDGRVERVALEQGLLNRFHLHVVPVQLRAPRRLFQGLLLRKVPLFLRPLRELRVLLPLAQRRQVVERHLVRLELAQPGGAGLAVVRHGVAGSLVQGFGDCADLPRHRLVVARVEARREHHQPAHPLAQLALWDPHAAANTFGTAEVLNREEAHVRFRGQQQGLVQETHLGQQLGLGRGGLPKHPTHLLPQGKVIPRVQHELFLLLDFRPVGGVFFLQPRHLPLVVHELVLPRRHRGFEQEPAPAHLGLSELGAQALHGWEVVHHAPNLHLHVLHELLERAA
mmetsp:Transcript_66792/g.134652  ORF Transcript_66792/g.134652 Transcript_66792/m.134652 type:complete len:403 (+) Transcript_66792:139-1347(+)